MLPRIRRVPFIERARTHRKRNGVGTYVVGQESYAVRSFREEQGRRRCALSVEDTLEEQPRRVRQEHDGHHDVTSERCPELARIVPHRIDRSRRTRLRFAGGANILLLFEKNKEKIKVAILYRRSSTG